MEMAAIEGTPKAAVRRLALSDPDHMPATSSGSGASGGVERRVDAIGNCSPAAGKRSLARPRPAAAISTAASGGKFDGALGVLAGLEVVRTLNDLRSSPRRPLELVNWTDEEGSRFGYS